MSTTGKHNITKKGRPKKLRTQVPLPGPWRNSSWVNSFGGKAASPLKFQEVSPSFILRQLLVLIEKGKFVDASQLLNKISIEALKDITEDIPIEPIIESIPQSLVVLESLYSRLFISDADNFPVESFQVEVMVFHIVRYLSMLQSSMEYKYPKPDVAKKSIINILRVVLHVNPDLVRTLYKRKKIMEKALRGIGEHGLIEMNGSLINLHDALKLEISRSVTSFKGAVSTLEHFSLANGKPTTIKINGDKKSGHGQNHQALTKLNEDQVKSRLYKNKALLNAIESRVNSQLPALIGTLKDRIEFDKNALLAFGKLKSEIKTFSSHTKVVPILAQYSKSLHTVMDILKELLDEHCGSSDKSSYSTLGYHSDEDMLSVQEMADDDDDVSQEAKSADVQPETEEDSVEKKLLTPVDPIEQVFGPVNEGHPEKMSLPGDETLERRSRWWKHHRRSRSLDMGSNRGPKRSTSSERTQPRSRSGSVDRSTISRPRRQSVEESQEFQQMMSRIRDMSASSPAVGRRQLERRGISHPRSRDSSISPAALRRHFFGGGEQTPSVSSQNDDIKDDDDPLYATIKPKAQRSLDKAGTKEAKKLEEVTKERDYLAEREKKLRQENESLRERLNLVTREMEKMKEGRNGSIEDDVFLPGRMDDPVVIIHHIPDPIEETASETLQSLQVEELTVSATDGTQEKALLASPEALSPMAPILPPASFSDQEDGSPLGEEPVSEIVSPPELDSPDLSSKNDSRSSSKKKMASFVEQQKAVLKERAEMLSRSGSKTHHHPTEELPESSVQQQKATFEKNLTTSQRDQSPVLVGKRLDVQKTNQPSSVEHRQQASTDQWLEVPARSESATEVQPDKLLDEQKKPSNDSPDLNADQPPVVDEPKESPVQPRLSTDDQPTNSPTPSQAPASQQEAVPDSEPVEPVPNPETPIHQQNSSSDSQEPANIQQKSIPRKPKNAKFANQLHMAAIPETSSPAANPKSANLVKQRRSPERPQQQSLTSAKTGPNKKGEDKASHTTRHLPKNYLRNITGDLLYEYDKLYSEQRAVAWTCLTIPPEDKDAVLFSVIVSAQITIHELHMAKARMLHIPITDDEESVSSYTMDIPPDNRSQVELLEHLRKMGDDFDFQPMIMDVLEQLLEISEHRRLLQDSAPLKKFVTSCVSLAWKLSIQSSPFIIDFELRSYDPAVHQRLPAANRKSSRVKEHIWPALLESTKGLCVYKGVVLT